MGPKHKEPENCILGAENKNQSPKKRPPKRKILKGEKDKERSQKHIKTCTQINTVKGIRKVSQRNT